MRWHKYCPLLPINSLDAPRRDVTCLQSPFVRVAFPHLHRTRIDSGGPEITLNGPGDDDGEV